MLSIDPYDPTDICETEEHTYNENEPYTRIFENHEDISDTYEDTDEVTPEINISKINNEIFESEEDMNASISNLCYGDFYILGRIWIETLKTVLIGSQIRLVPVVHAAKPPPEPQRPPKMKYMDLPIYTSPHYEYKEHEVKKDECAEAKTKLLHNYLLPYVKKYRIETQNQLCKMRCAAKGTIKDVGCSIDNTSKDIKKFMRDPANKSVRQGVVATGTILGCLMGSNLPKKFFLAGLGGLSTGALCFPDETDDFFRSFMWQAGTTFIKIYNTFCGKNFKLRKRVPCTTEVPPEPTVRRKQQCPKPKKAAAKPPAKK